MESIIHTRFKNTYLRNTLNLQIENYLNIAIILLLQET